MKVSYTQICKSCGSENVARLKWVNVNTEQLIEGDPETGITTEWCFDCKAETQIIEKEEQNPDTRTLEQKEFDLFFPKVNPTQEQICGTLKEQHDKKPCDKCAIVNCKDYAICSQCDFNGFIERKENPQ